MIAVWDVDWNDAHKNGVIQRLLCHKLGAASEERVFVRNTEVVSISTSDARDFCDLNHIQGFSSGSMHNGLKDKNTGRPVSVGAWRKIGRHST